MRTHTQTSPNNICSICCLGLAMCEFLIFGWLFVYACVRVWMRCLKWFDERIISLTAIKECNSRKGESTVPSLNTNTLHPTRYIKLEFIHYTIMIFTHSITLTLHHHIQPTIGLMLACTSLSPLLHLLSPLHLFVSSSSNSIHYT